MLVFFLSRRCSNVALFRMLLFLCGWCCWKVVVEMLLLLECYFCKFFVDGSCCEVRFEAKFKNAPVDLSSIISHNYRMTRHNIIQHYHAATPHQTIPHHTTPYHIIPNHHIIPQLTAPHHTTPHHTTPKHTTPHHATPQHTTPPHTNHATWRQWSYMNPSTSTDTALVHSSSIAN